MAIARVVAFEGVTGERIEELRRQMDEADGPPDEIPASELLILHDPQGQKSLAIVFFENEDDYARGHAALDAMPTEDTPGGRVSVDKYDVAIRMMPDTAAR